jgi:uncharacterized membrane protein YsdA (DUF1294 family)
LYFYFIWLAITSLITFILYGIDKAQSKKHGHRISENALHLLALAGGFLGGWIGRSLFHHKTKKGIFTFVLVISTVVHVGLFYWLSK